MCVRGRALLDHLLHDNLAADGWQYVVEGTAANPKPGLVARERGRVLRICWKPPGVPAPTTTRAIAPAELASTAMTAASGRLLSSRTSLTKLSSKIRSLEAQKFGGKRTTGRRHAGAGHRYAFKLGFLKSYGEGVGGA